jgi:hypothetical protein
MSLCPSCGDSLGSRYHEVAHSPNPDLETMSLEDLEAAAAIYARAVADSLSRKDPA